MFSFIVGFALFQNGAKYVQHLRCVYKIYLKKSNFLGVFVIDVRSGNGSVKFGPTANGRYNAAVQRCKLVIWIIMTSR